MRRLAVAAAISLALHEAAAGLLPSGMRLQTHTPEVIRHVQVLRIAFRAPRHATLRPLQRQPSPSPPPVSVKRPEIIKQWAALRKAAHPLRGNVSPRDVALRSVPVSASQAAQLSAGNGGAVNGSAASLGSGESAGSGGSSDGAATGGNQPCGFVIFSDPHGSQYDPKTRGFWVDIRMAVHFADGSFQSLILDYPWYYSSEAANPWSAQNLKDPNFPTRFQTPPPERAPGEPALVKYVADHSNAEGMTLLRDCAAIKL